MMLENKNEYLSIVNIYKNKFEKLGYPFKNTSELVHHEWIKIRIKFERISAPLLPFIIMINEIFRFEVGPTQPECRLSDSHIFSKRVEQGADVDLSSIRTLYYYLNQFLEGKSLFWEGMGRVIFFKFLYQENDFNFYNALLDKNNYFIGLDNETCFWSVTEKYHYSDNHKPSDVKAFIYNHSPYTHEIVKGPNGHPIYIVNSKKRSFMGNIRKEDYDNLPLLKYACPSNWFFIYPEMKKYSQLLAKNKLFINEKHFSALKTLITFSVKKLLIDLHMTDEKDKQDALDFVNHQLAKLIDICSQSQDFQNYLRENGLSAMKAILYEVNYFFNDDSIYALEPDLLNFILEYFHDEIIKQYTKLVEFLHSDNDCVMRDNLNLFSKEIRVDRNKFNDEIKLFYLDQDMTYHASKIVSVHE